MPRQGGRRKKTRTHNLTRDPDAVDKLEDGNDEGEMIPRCKLICLDMHAYQAI